MRLESALADLYTVCSRLLRFIGCCWIGEPLESFRVVWGALHVVESKSIGHVFEGWPGQIVIILMYSFAGIGSYDLVLNIPDLGDASKTSTLRQSRDYYWTDRTEIHAESSAQAIPNTGILHVHIGCQRMHSFNSG